MNLDELRMYCLSLPGTTECIQWGNDLLFKVGEKMFVGASLTPPHSVSIKCDDESFASLTERNGIVPAPYLARHKWIMLESLDTLPHAEFTSRVQASYKLVFERLPKRTKLDIAQGAATSE